MALVGAECTRAGVLSSLRARSVCATHWPRILLRFDAGGVAMAGSARGYGVVGATSGAEGGVTSSVGGSQRSRLPVAHRPARPMSASPRILQSDRVIPPVGLLGEQAHIAFQRRHSPPLRHLPQPLHPAVLVLRIPRQTHGFFPSMRWISRSKSETYSASCRFRNTSNSASAFNRASSALTRPLSSRIA